MTDAIDWPEKSRELVTPVLDSTRWNGFAFRDDDIVISTWSKSGTSLTQQILAQLIFNGDEDALGLERSSWLDFRFAPAEVLLATADAQTHRRFMKTHLPLEALVFSPRAKYLYIGRDARDVFWSWHHHHSIFSDAAYELMNPPDRTWPEVPRPDPDIRRAYHAWLDGETSPNGPLWPHVQGWWDARHLPNVKLLHFNDLRSDLAGSIRQIAAFLDIAIDEATFPSIVEHCGIDFMRAKAAKLDVLELIFDGGGGEFINKGINGRWRDVLSADEIARADAIAAQHLSPDCARWLRTGELS